MSGSIGGSRIKRAEVQPTLDAYVEKVLKKFPGYKNLQITGSYNAGTKPDHGDIDIAIHIQGNDVKKIKKDFKAYLESLPDDVTHPFTFGKRIGDKAQLFGAIVTCGFPIVGRPNDFVQIDNIVVTNENELRFQKCFLDLNAAKQALITGLMRVIMHYKDRKDIEEHFGFIDFPQPSSNQEYEFVISPAGLSYRLVTLGSDMREKSRVEMWRSTNWDDVEYLLKGFDLQEDYEDLLDDVHKMIKRDRRSCERIVGVMKSIINIGVGEVGTPKGDDKQRAIDLAQKTLLESKMMSLYQFLCESEGIFHLGSKKTFEKKDFAKHDYKYSKEVIRKLIAGEEVKIGPWGEVESIRFNQEQQEQFRSQINMDDLNIDNFNEVFKSITNYKWNDIWKAPYSGYDGGSKINTLTQETISSDIFNSILTGTYDESETLSNIFEKYKINPSKDWIISWKKQIVQFQDLISKLKTDGPNDNYVCYQEKQLFQTFKTLKDIYQNIGHNKNAVDPSDVYLVNTKLIDSEKNILNNENIQDINDLSKSIDFLNKLFNDKMLIGISLKKCNEQSKDTFDIKKQSNDDIQYKADNITVAKRQGKQRDGFSNYAFCFDWNDKPWRIDMRTQGEKYWRASLVFNGRNSAAQGGDVPAYIWRDLLGDFFRVNEHDRYKSDPKKWSKYIDRLFQDNKKDDNETNIIKNDELKQCLSIMYYAAHKSLSKNIVSHYIIC